MHAIAHHLRQGDGLQHWCRIALIQCDHLDRFGIVVDPDRELIMRARGSALRRESQQTRGRRNVEPVVRAARRGEGQLQRIRRDRRRTATTVVRPAGYERLSRGTQTRRLK